MIVTALAFFATAQNSQPDFAKEWQEIRRSISRSYYARKTREAEMNRILDEFGVSIGGSRSPAEFESNVNRMIDAFHDSHFSYLTKSDQGWYLMDSLAKRDTAESMPNIGAWFRKTPSGYAVQMLLDGLSAMASDLRKGDVIEQIEGRPFTPVESLRPFVGQEVSLTLRRGVETLSRKIRVNSPRVLPMFLEASTNSVKIIEDHGRRIGYFHLWTMANDDFRSALSNAIYGKLKNTDGFILDLRDGFGGRPEGYADPLFRPEVELDWITSDNKTEQLFGYGRPMVTIINEGSRSAKEVLSYILKKGHRCTFVGSRTAGNVLGTFPERLSNGSYIEIPIADVFTDGSRLEGKGVSPDISVPQEFDSSGKDLDLNSALGHLKNIPTFHRFDQA